MDAIALVSSALVAAIVAALLFLLPGLAVGPIILPGAASPLVIVGRAAGVSLLATLTACTILAWLGALTGPVLVVVLLAIIGAGLAVRYRRGELTRGSGARRRRGWLWTVAALAVLVLLLIVPSIMRTGDDLRPKSSTSWYYINLAQTMADAGAIPDQLAEWGSSRPYQTDYLPTTAHTASALLLMPGGQLVVIEIYRVATLVLAALFAALLFRRWLPGWIAALAAISLLATVRLADKFDAYRPETMGLVIALFTLWVADRAFMQRDRRTLVVTLLGAALVWLSHAEVFLVMAALLLGMAVARVVVPLRAAQPSIRRLLPLAAAGTLLGGGVVLATIAGWVLTGGPGVIGYLTGAGSGASSAAGAPSIEDGVRGRPGEIPAGWSFTDDPTWDFYVASVSPGLLGLPPPDAFTDAILLPRSILHVWPGLDARTRDGKAILGGLLVAPLLLLPFLDRKRRRLVVTVVVFGLALTAGSMLLFELSSTYVPQRTGGRRLMPYLLFLPVASFGILLWGLARLAAPGWRALLPGRGRVLASCAALALITAAAVAGAPPRPGAPVAEDEASLSRTGFDAYRWVATNLPSDARILANAYTDGAIAAVASRLGIIDGRAVYLEDPAFLAEATALCLGARVVFADPSSQGAGTYLARERVTHLVVAAADRGSTGSDLGGYLLFDTDVAALRANPRFRLLAAFGDGAVGGGAGEVLIFEVGPAAALH